MWIRYLLLVLVLTFGALNVAAEETSSRESGLQNEEEVFQPVDEIDSITKKLIRAIDLWHDANLKGDRSLIDQHQQTIFTVLEADLNSSREQAKHDRRLADSLNTLAVREKAKQSTSLSRVKAYLIRSMRNTQAFSNRYRLLGDYLEVLEMERKGRSVELADRHLQDASGEGEGR